MNTTMKEAPVVGQEVAVFSGYGDGHNYSVYSVKRVTPKGQLVIAHPSSGFADKRFGPDGYEISSDKWHRSWIRTDLDACRAEATVRALRYKAAKAIEAVRVERSLPTYGTTWMANQIIELQQKLDEARLLVAQLPVESA